MAMTMAVIIEVSLVVGGKNGSCSGSCSEGNNGSCSGDDNGRASGSHIEVALRKSLA